MSNTITIKLRLSSELPDMFAEFQRQFCNVFRYNYNRACDGVSKFDCFKLLNDLNNVDLLDLSWRREACKAAYNKHYTIKQTGNNPSKVIFGGKGNFHKRIEGKITHQELDELRNNMPVCFEGSKAEPMGNRKFKFDLTSQTGVVYINKQKVGFSVCNISKKNRHILEKAYKLVDDKQIGLTYSLSKVYLYITIDLDKIYQPKEPDKLGRTLSLDMNPNYIGLVISDDNQVYLKQAYDLSKIENHNKKKHELTEIAKAISSLCKQYNVSYVGYEKLSIKSSDKSKGRRFNKQCNNDWIRKRFVDSMHKWLTLNGIKYQEIAPEYSSFIGCIMHPEETDSIAAAMELNRRLRQFLKIYVYKTVPVGTNVVYPDYDGGLFNRWKESADQMPEFDGWKTAYKWFKETKTSYRFHYTKWIKSTGVVSLRFKSYKSQVNVGLGSA